MPLADIDLLLFIEADEVKIPIPVAVEQAPLKVSRGAAWKTFEGILGHLDQGRLLATRNSSYVANEWLDVSRNDSNDHTITIINNLSLGQHVQPCH